ncbi:MAG: hypothetical protein V1895_04150 [Parcubacteria group bacterium]
MSQKTEVLTKSYFKSYLDHRFDNLGRSIARGFEDLETRLGARIDTLSARVDSLEKRIMGLEGHMGKVEFKLTAVENRLTNVEKNQGNLERQFDAHLRELTVIKKRLRSKPNSGEVRLLEKRVVAIERALNLVPARARR